MTAHVKSRGPVEIVSQRASGLVESGVSRPYGSSPYRQLPRPKLAYDGRGLGESGAEEPRWGLRRTLLALDAAAVALAWLLLQALPGGAARWARTGGAASWATLAAIIVGALAAISGQRLYQARACSVSAEESAGLLRAAAIAAAMAFALSAYPGGYSVAECLAGFILSFVLLRASRSIFRSWLQNARRHGRFTRPIVIVGDNEEAAEIFALLTDHPEIGYRVCGIVGRADRVRRLDLPVRCVGDFGAVPSAVRRVGANGVVVAVTAMTLSEVNLAVRELVAAGIHVHLSNGVQGIANRRLRVQQFAQEPMRYLEPVTLGRWQVMLKRCIDVAVASLVLLLATPVMLLAAAALLVTDGRPLIFAQERVGRHGARFMIFKFRTMIKDAEERAIDLRERNDRDGPLFKLSSDPRVTVVGRVLRALSIDELPQLVNVLRGEMSLVGPRPALPSEVEEFDDELMARLEVAPGITGLWQVEARDNPSFSAYRRLDLFYLENWSVFLDITILLATVRVVLFRGLQVIGGRLRPHRDDSIPAAVLE